MVQAKNQTTKSQGKPWDQVGTQFELLGEHLRGRFDHVGAEASAERKALEKALRGLVKVLDDAFGSASEVARDPKLRQEIINLAESVRSALLATIERAGGSVSGPVRRTVSPATAKQLPVGRATTAERAAPKKSTTKKVAARSAGRKVAADKVAVRSAGGKRVTKH